MELELLEDADVLAVQRLLAPLEVGSGDPLCLEAVNYRQIASSTLSGSFEFAAEDERHVVPATHHFGAKGIVDQPLVVQFSVKRGALPGRGFVEDLIEDSS